MTNLNIALLSRGFKKVPHGMKTEDIWRRDKIIVMQKRVRFPKPMTAVFIQGSKNCDGKYVIGTDDEKLKGAIKRI